MNIRKVKIKQVQRLEAKGKNKKRRGTKQREKRDTIIKLQAN
jgi:hypothetical protein